MKIKDLDENYVLKGALICVPDETFKKQPNSNATIQRGYWESQWGYREGKAGVWLKKSQNDKKVYPIFIDSLMEVLEWEVIPLRFC